MNETSLAALCERVRPELACLGDLGEPLLDVVTVVERVGRALTVSALAEPAFALDVLTAAGRGADAAVIGRVLDFLRQRVGAARSQPVLAVPAVTIATAVDEYETGASALLAKGSRYTYRTWTRRLTAEFGGRSPRSITAGDLTDLVARHVVAKRSDDDRRRTGRSAEENAVGAFRHFWGYLVEKGYATENVAQRLKKPPRIDPRRRGYTPEEAALLRQLARNGRDPLLDELTLGLSERLGLRRIESCRVRVSDIAFDRRTVEVWGKCDKYRTMPIPPALFELIEEYVEDRRPAHLALAEWRRSDELLLRRRPAGSFPLGRPAGRRRIEDLFTRLQEHAPDLFSGGDLSLHSYRHAIGTFIDGRYGRATTRAVLGHTSRRTPTDAYVHVSIERVAEALADYEAHLLQWDRARVIPIEAATEVRRAG